MKAAVFMVEKPTVFDGITWPAGYYWLPVDDQGVPPMGAYKALAESHHPGVVLIMSDNEAVMYGPYGHPGDAAFGALDAGYEPGEAIGTGYLQ